MIEQSLLKQFFKPASEQSAENSGVLKFMAKLMPNCFALCSFRGPIEPSILGHLPKCHPPNYLIIASLVNSLRLYLPTVEGPTVQSTRKGTGISHSSGYSLGLALQNYLDDLSILFWRCTRLDIFLHPK